MGRELFDDVFQSILVADVTKDMVQDGEARRNSFLDLLLEIATPRQADSDLDGCLLAA